jgi:hypothetical protein
MIEYRQIFKMIFIRYKFLLYFILFSFLYINIENVFALQIKNVNFGASNNNDRWIEVFNNGADILDFTISDYKILDSKDTTKHSIMILQGDSAFAASTSIFISPSTNIPTGATKVFRSNYTLDKTNGFISIINSDNTGTYSCFAYGDISCPQSGSINNSTSTNSTSTSSTSTTTSTSGDSSSPNIIYVYVPSNNQNKYGDISVLLPTEKLIPAGADSEFDVKAIDKDKKAIMGLNFQWSFGDGGEKFGQKVFYHYTYPGEYTLVASADGYTVGGEAKMNVKVVTPDIIISKVGTSSKENFIDLTNNTDYDLVLSNFYLNLDNNFYKLPKNFTIEKKKSIHVSGEAVGFKLPATNISLNYPNKNFLVSYTNINNNSASNTIVLKLNAVENKPDLLSEESTKIKTEENTREVFLEKELQTEFTKQTKESFILKRLVLSQKVDTKTLVDSKPLNLNKTKNVDTGIVNWFKSLIY